MLPRTLPPAAADPAHALVVYPRRVLLLACAGMFCAATALAAGFALCSRTELSAGTSATAVAIADLNHDGIPDVVSANFSAYTISVLLGKGGGKFATRVDYATGVQPSALAIGDVDGDGHPDVAVTNYFSNTVSIFLGTGIGTFVPKTDVATGLGPFAVAITDLNGDGRADLVVANYTSGTVSVLLGNDAGGFATRVDYAAGLGTRSVKVGDMTGDGFADVVACNVSGNTVSVWPGDGRGGLGTRTDYTTATGPRVVAIGDLNWDGVLDVVTANTNVSNVSVFLGTGLGVLGAKTDYATGTGAYSVAIGDVDADRKPDLVVADYNANTVSVLIGTGTGTFGAKTDFATGTGPRSVAIEDVTGDGYPDVLTANYGSATVSVLVSGVSNGFGATSYLPTTFGFGFCLTDVTGDGNADLVGATNLGVRVQPGNGAGGLAAGVEYPTGGGIMRGVATGDFDGNGLLDLVTANTDNSASVLLNDGNGGFVVGAGVTTGIWPTGVAVGDLNGDGFLDFVTANFSGNTVSRVLGSEGVHFGTKSDFGTGANPAGVVIGKFNSDAYLDLAVCNSGSTTVSVLPGDGAGGFGARVDYTVGGTAEWIAMGDLNGDGRLDLATANRDPGSVSVMLSDGANSFLAKTDYSTGTGSKALGIVIADLNGDGWNDIAVSLTIGQSVCVLLGAGNGAFNTRMDFPLLYYAHDVAAGDLDGDGRLDIAAGAYYNEWIAILRSLSLTRISLATGPNPSITGAPLVMTATVAAVSSAAGVPTGAVYFFDGMTPLGVATLSGGVASLVSSGSRLGARALSAIYYGNGTFQRSISPVCTQRVVAAAKPVLTSIADVKNDQGGQVRARFRASPFDFVGSGVPIVRYDVFRRVDEALMARARAVRATSPAGALLYGWDLVGSLAAYCDTAYSLVVPTLADSNGSGYHRAALLVRAATATPGVYYDSPADSGYSVDNLPPAPPAPFTAAYASGVTHLHWGASTAADFWYYRVYRGESEAFAPGPANLVATPADTGYADAGHSGYWYKLSAVDVNGNESGYAVLSPGGTTDVVPGVSTAFALEGVRPNPSRGEPLTVSFVLPSGEPARLELMDVSGRRVLGREVGALGAGRHVVDLAGEGRLPPGLYLVRIAQGANMRTARVVVLK